MLYFNPDERQMVKHTAEVMGDRVGDDDNGYEPGDDETVTKLDRMGKAPSSCVVITGEELTHLAATEMFQSIVLAEMANWVPDASQRLIHRAGHALGVRHPRMLSSEKDCGAEPGWHALIADWICGMYVRRCMTCCRIFADTARGTEAVDRRRDV